jgi:hypothetical protein
VFIYRHPKLLTPPDLEGWQPRGDVAVCSQDGDGWRYAGVCDPVYWKLPPASAEWKALGDGWEGVRVASAESPEAHLARVDCFAPVLPVEDAAGRGWLAPVILSQDGARAFPVAYAGEDFLPAPTPLQARAEAVAKEARTALLAAMEGGDGLPVAAACRWASLMLTITTHVSAKTIAELGVLDDTLIRRVLIVAAGLDRRLDAGGN